MGSLAVQLLRERGVRVLGIASPATDGALTELDATAIHNGDGLAERLRTAAPDGIDAFIDIYGPDYARLAMDLDIPRDRVERLEKRHTHGKIVLLP